MKMSIVSGKMFDKLPQKRWRILIFQLGIFKNWHLTPTWSKPLWEDKILSTNAINRSLDDGYFTFPPPTRKGLTFLVSNHKFFDSLDKYFDGSNEIIKKHAIYQITY